MGSPSSTLSMLYTISVLKQYISFSCSILSWHKKVCKTLVMALERPERTTAKCHLGQGGSAVIVNYKKMLNTDGEA